MKRETALDYAEFLLTQTRTRCELYISADGVKEKLASGYLKPFVTHLRAAELQMARDSQIIRLERPPDLSKKNNNTWFTKGTLERFVRFVSTPEVLELVKNIEDELSQLEQVRIALSKTFSQSEVQFPTIDTTFSPTGAYPERGGMSMMPRRLSMDADDNGAEASKRELLRAMDVRLTALKQEQNLAFSRATAAGFDSSNIADLMDFSEHFGAERLRDACLQFIGLSRKRNIPQEVDEELDSPSADAASTGSDMSLGSGTDFELAAETEATFPLSVRSSEAWLNAQKVSVFDAGKKFGDLKSGSQEKTNVSMDGTSVRTRSRWGPPERIQINCLDPEVCSLQDSEISGKVPEINDQIAHHTCQDGIRLRESGMRTFQAEEGSHSTAHFEEHSTFTKQSPIVLTDSTPSLFKGQKQQGDKKGESVGKGGMFFTRLQKMAQQVEARRSGEDLGVHFTSVGMSDESPASEVSALGKSSMLLESVWNPLESSHSYTVQDFGDEGVAQPQSQDSKMAPRPPSPGRNFPISPERLQVGSPHSQSSNSVVILAADHSYPVDRLNQEKDKTEKPAEMHATETESSKSRDNQEEPISTSARRLSVQAAISLFESKKPNVGEASSKKLVRQESQKGATQSGGSSTSEKAVLRRWSGIGIASPRDSSTHDKAPDLDTKEPRKNVEIEYGTEKDDSTSRNSNLMIDKQAQSAADKNSTQASKLFRNTFPHLTSAQQSGPEADALSSKIGPFVQQQPLAAESSTWPGGDLQKQFKLELEKSLTRNGQNSIRVDAVLPSKSVADASKTSDFVTKKLPKDLTSEIKGQGQPTVNSMVPDIKGRLGHEEKRNWTEQNMKPLPGKLALTGPTVPSLSNFKEDKADSSMPASLKQDFPSAKESNIVKLINETDRNSQTECKLSSGRFSGDTQQNLGEEPSSIFYDISVDLYMQALVMMIDNNHQSSLNFGDEESLIEQRGRFYEHYRRVRNARQRGEHPAKRAEREAKLNSMKETLERRKAEMEAGALRPSKKNSQLVKEQMRVGKLQAQKPGLMITQKEQEELGEEEEGIDQEDQLLYALSPASKNHVSTLKAQAAKKSAPTLQKCATAPRTSMQTASASSPRAILKNTTGTSSQRKLAIPSYNGTVDNSINRSVPSLVEFRKEVSKSSSGRSVATSRVSAKVNGHSRTVSDAAALAESGNMVAIDDALSGIADEEMKGQSSLTRKSHTSPSEVKTSSAQALDQIVLESFKGHEDVGADSVVNGKSCSVVQEVKSFLRKAQGIGPGSGPGVTKQKVSTIVDTLKSFDEQVLSDSIVCEEETDPDSLGRADLEVEDLRKSFVPDELDCFAEHAVSMTSILPNNYSLNDEGSLSVNKGQLDGLDVEATGYVLVDASGDGKVLSTDEVDEGKHQRNFSEDTISVAHNSFTGSANHEKRHGVVTLAEKTTELSQSDSNSSASLRAASLPPECTTNTHSNAAASPANSSEWRPGTVPGPFSLRPAMLSDSPLGSPASWNSSQAKNFSEHDLIHSRRQFSGPQKPVSIMSQSIKEPAKGFKRLLHFGRKSRASEAASTDCVSASTTSEGDDDTEEAKELVRQSSDDLFRRAKLQERGSDYGNNGDHYSFQDQGATHSLRSSIPAPPANFKLREDHLSGGTLLKAPRSFFSLSSFRSRGGEGKPR